MPHVRARFPLVALAIFAVLTGLTVPAGAHASKVGHVALEPDGAPGIGRQLDVEVSSARRRAYVVGANRLTSVDLAGRAIAVQVPFPSSYGWSAIDETAGTLFVSDARHTVYAYDLATLAPRGAIALFGNGARRLRDLAVDPVTHRVYVADFDSDELFILDGVTGTFITKASTIDGPVRVVVHDGERIFVGSQLAGRIAEHANDGALVRTTKGGYHLAINEDRDLLYTALDYEDGYDLRVVDLADLSTVALVPLPDGAPYGPIAVDPLTSRVYAHHFIIDGWANEVVQELSLSTQDRPFDLLPGGLAFDRSGGLLALANPYWNELDLVADVDDEAPDGMINQYSPVMSHLVGVAEIGGTATDAFRGIGRVTAIYRGEVSGVHRIVATVACPEPRRDCIWRADVPRVADGYRVSVEIEDRAGNSALLEPSRRLVVASL